MALTGKTTWIVRTMAAATLLIACGQPATEARPRATSLFAAEADLRVPLPAQIREVSGLAVAPDGRLFAHDDEKGVIHEIDVARGTFVKSFRLGQPVLREDFEGLAITPDGTFWLTTSTGQLYRFREGGDGETVAFERFDAGVEQLCEIEGLAYFAAEDSLILACKIARTRSMGDTGMVATQVLLSWSEARGAQEWRVLRESFAAAADVRRFRPSGIEFDPSTGRIVLISANDAAMVELDGDGALLAGRELEGEHPQPEGAAILADGSLIIVDEARDRDSQAQLSRYPRAP